MKSYDIAIIGAGWAGFNAALRAESLGLKVALIEKSSLGGTCLNRGCIPTKFLVQTAKIFSQAKKANQYGIEISNPAIKFNETIAKKKILVDSLRNNLEGLIKSKNSVDLINAKARFLSKNEISLGDEKIAAKYTLIASGSEPKELGNLKFDASKILSSNQILDLENLPKNILIIGGGVIGCEFASIFSSLGVEVSIVEYLDRLLPAEDAEISRKLESIFKKRKINIKTKTNAQSVDLEGFDKVLLCTGRKPNTSDLGLEGLHINFEKERIITDEHMCTNIENIYAAGDCTSIKQLAHVATHQAIIAAENTAGKKHTFDYRLIPNCIFTDPEIASVGMDEEIARECGMEIDIDRFDFMGSGMARILSETEGFVKIISDKKTDKIIGASLIGPKATELISALTLAIETHLTRKEVADTMFAHPTLAESISEALRRGVYGF